MCGLSRVEVSENYPLVVVYGLLSPVASLVGGAQVLGTRTSLVEACGLSNCESLALGHMGFSSCGSWALECASFSSCGTQACLVTPERVESIRSGI